MINALVGLGIGVVMVALAAALGYLLFRWEERP